VVEVLGVRFHNLSRDEAAEAIADMVRRGEKGYVVKPYSEFMPRAAREPHIPQILNGADLCLADGIGILWAVHYLSLPGGPLRALAQLPLSLAAMTLNPAAVRRPLKENMAGVDLTWEMLAKLDEAGSWVFLLGGTEEEVQGTRRRIEARFPNLTIVGARNGYFEESNRIVEPVNAAQPQALLVALGFPRQEEWIAENMPCLKVNVAVAEGGSFSFISGATRRAPRWLRRMGLEWLYRLARQPWRLRRQLAILEFLRLVIRERLRAARGGL
jgi:N-acetylglucosaminyldiphosphoundecaprenol N-acetyl-beta-D-mannosaminyltransferase